MKSTRNVTRWTTALTLLSIVFAVWNTFDEYPPLQNIVSFSVVLAAWIAVPCLNALLGIRSKHEIIERISLVLATIYALLFAFYALNGSTVSRPEGAQHLHVVLMPLLLLFCSPFLFCLLLILFHAREQRGWKTDASSPADGE